MPPTWNHSEAKEWQAATSKEFAILDGRFTLTEHAYDEMAEDNLDVLDIESAILTGTIDQVLTMDPRGTRFVVIGTATDQQTPVGVVSRFVEHDHLLIMRTRLNRHTTV